MVCNHLLSPRVSIINTVFLVFFLFSFFHFLRLGDMSQYQQCELHTARISYPRPIAATIIRYAINGVQASVPSLPAPSATPQPCADHRQQSTRASTAASRSTDQHRARPSDRHRRVGPGGGPQEHPVDRIRRLAVGLRQRRARPRRPGRSHRVDGVVVVAGARQRRPRRAAGAAAVRRSRAPGSGRTRGRDVRRRAAGGGRRGRCAPAGAARAGCRAPVGGRRRGCCCELPVMFSHLRLRK